MARDGGAVSVHALAQPTELARLRELVTLFLHEKGIHGAGGMVVREEVRIAIAIQACILILDLGLDYYRGWVEVIVYPDEFVAEREFVDEAGVAHTIEEPMTGESWERGPVILSWADANEGGRAGGYNVVIHEFAHKLDMLNGEPNGFPPLHADMSRAAWAAAFTRAYEDFCAKVDADAWLDIDDYAAESPAEFFAVMSEVFFESPHSLRVTVSGRLRAACAVLPAGSRRPHGRDRTRAGRALDRMMKLRVPRRYTLLVGLGVFLAALVIVSVVGFGRSRHAGEPLQAVVEQQYAKTGLAAAMFRMARERLQLVREAGGGATTAASRALGAQRYRSVADEFHDGVRKLGAAVLDGRERGALDALVAATQGADEVLDHVLELVFTGDAAGALKLLDASGLRRRTRSRRRSTRGSMRAGRPRAGPWSMPGCRA